VPASDPRALKLLQNSQAALLGGSSIADVTLTGTAQWIAGSEDESGTVTYKGLNSAYRLDMTFRNGSRSEMMSLSNGIFQGTWIGLDGVSHSMASHNMMNSPGWFPLFVITSFLSSSSSELVYVGQESKEGVSSIHLQSRQVSADISVGSAFSAQRQTVADVYLDATTLMPVSYLYTSHPDNNIYRDVPTEVRYSNYRTFGGSQIPFRVQKFMNGTLVLDLQFQSATLNSGMTAAQVASAEN
jgi:hypothetical protein